MLTRNRLENIRIIELCVCPTFTWRPTNNILPYTTIVNDYYVWSSIEPNTVRNPSKLLQIFLNCLIKKNIQKCGCFVELIST